MSIGRTARAVLQVHPTRLCNLRCLHCYSSSGPDVTESLPVGLLTGTVRDAASLGYDVLSVSGGEPFLYPELPTLLRAGRDAGMRTSITTNATVLTQRRIAAIRGVVDLVAVSMDGAETTHDRIRDRRGSFERALTGIRRLAEVGIPVGVITTLTRGNATELDRLARAVAGAGAVQLEVHPLELEGAGRSMQGDRPEPVELAYAAVELGRIAEEHGLAVQLDAVPRTLLATRPELFMATPPPVDQPLGKWLTPLVVEPSGVVVPVAYGFHRRYGLGNLADASLAGLAEDWDPSMFLHLCRDTWQQLVDGQFGPLIRWYGHLLRASRVTRSAAPQHSGC